MADFGSREAGKKGGKARASKLTPQQRSDIARKGAAARWSAKEDVDLPRAICGGKEPLRIGDAEIPCYVLEADAVPTDEDRRVVTVAGLQLALGMTRSGGAPRLVSFAKQIADNPSMVHNLSVRLDSPIEFSPPSGGVAKGYPATVLADLCDAILEARKKGLLTDRYKPIANAAEVVMRGFANVGIIALIDEATGYQAVRRRLELAEILDTFLDDNLNVWTKTFPDDFYKEFFRLKGWDYETLKPGDIKPAEVGRFTRDEVYRRLHPGIVDELEKRNPCIMPGKRLRKHHQWLTEEIGHPALEKHVAVFVAMMKVSPNMMQFMANIQKVLPKASDTEYFDFIDGAG